MVIPRASRDPPQRARRTVDCARWRTSSAWWQPRGLRAGAVYPCSPSSTSPTSRFEGSRNLSCGWSRSCAFLSAAPARGSSRSCATGAPDPRSAGRRSLSGSDPWRIPRATCACTCGKGRWRPACTTRWCCRPLVSPTPRSCAPLAAAAVAAAVARFEACRSSSSRRWPRVYVVGCSLISPWSLAPALSATVSRSRSSLEFFQVPAQIRMIKINWRGFFENNCE